MTVYRNAAAATRNGVSTSVANGRSFIARCELLDSQMSEVDSLAQQVADVKRALGELEGAVGAHSKE